MLGRSRLTRLDSSESFGVTIRHPSMKQERFLGFFNNHLTMYFHPEGMAMPVVRDLMNKRFGRLLVVGLSPERQREHKVWICVCDCGKSSLVMSQNLLAGNTRSCGCIAREILFKRSFKHGHSPGHTSSTEYRTWRGMQTRCYNKNDHSYPPYGGRGIKICDRWRNSFENFLADMGLKPTPQHTIERNDNDKDYSPENCRWATYVEQANNRRSTRLLTLRGETLSAATWATRMGITRAQMYGSLSRGRTIQQIEEKFRKGK